MTNEQLDAVGNPRDKAAFVLIASTIAMGLMAGVYFAFACAVIPGLQRTDDRTFISAINQINLAIQNPVFFASFFGAFILSAVSAWQHRRSGMPEITKWIVLALVLYAVGFFVTMGINVPLNEQLKNAGDPAQLADPAAALHRFLGPWVAWNIVRTMASTAALGCLSWALLLRARARWSVQSANAGLPGAPAPRPNQL